MNLFRAFFLSLGPLCAALAYATLVKPLALPRKWNACLAAALLAFSLKFTWFATFGGSMFLPEMPEGAIHALSVLYDFVLVSAVAGAAFSIATAALRRCGGTVEPGRRRFIAGALSFGAAGVAAKGVHDGIRLPDVVDVTLFFPDLPAAFDGYRIAHLSDLHISAAARAERTAGVVRLANALKPDAVAITGDFVDGAADVRAADVLPLAELRAADGVFGCTGNHEYYSGYGEWRKVFRDCGIRMLENAAHVARHGADALVIAGVNDPVSLDSDAAAACAGTPPFRILLAHRPTRLAAHAELGVRMQLSGHTHGGAVFGLDRLVARANEGHVRGLYREHGLQLYVNAGTGQWAGFPTRIGVPPEITHITLRRSM